MKAVEECFDRFYAEKKPLKSKWQVIRVEETEHLAFYHYQHLVLVYDDHHWVSVYQWWEVPTDKRGLDAALEYLRRRKLEVDDPF